MILAAVLLSAPIAGAAPPEIPADMPKSVRVHVEKLLSPDRKVRAQGLVGLWAMHDRARPAARRGRSGLVRIADGSEEAATARKQIRLLFALEILVLADQRPGAAAGIDVAFP